MKKLFASTILIIAMVAIATPIAATTAPMVAHAQVVDGFARLQLPSELRPAYVPDITIAGEEKPGFEAAYGNFFLQLLAGGLLYLAAPTAIAFVAFGGTRYVISHGDQSKMDAAKKTIEYAIIGLVVIMLSFALVRALITIIVKTG